MCAFIESEILKIVLAASDEKERDKLFGFLTELCPEGFEFKHCRDYQEALEEFQKQSHHIGIVSHKLDPQSGLELLPHICSIYRRPAIFLSQNNDFEMDEAALRAGATDYLVEETLDVTQLRRSMRYALERARACELMRHDIEERIRVEEELKRQRTFLRQVIDINPNFVFAKDRQGRFTLVNQAVAEAYGTTVEELIGKSDADFNPNSEEVQHFRQDDIAVMDSKTEKFIPEEIITDAHGNSRWLQTVKRPIVDPSGTTNLVLGIATDITARKEAEERLRESEERYRTLAESSAVGIWHVYNEGTTIYANPTMRSMLEVDSSAELTGALYQDFFSPESLQRMDSEKPLRLQGLASTYEVEIIGRRGGRKNVVLSGAPLFSRDGRWLSVLGTFIDITPRKQAEQALQESEERYRVFAENITVGFWHTSKDDTTIYINRAMCEMLDVESPAEVEGKSYRDFFTPESCDIIESEHKKRVLGLSSTYEVELVSSRGTRRWVTISAAPIFSGERHLESYIATLTDVTEQHEVEEERRRLEAQMQHAQKLESLGVLAGGIAHDFNNLLMGILGNAGLALLDLPPASPARGRIEQIKKASERASELTNQLLAYTGKGTFVVRPVNLSRVVEEMGELLGTVISKKAVIEYHFNSELPCIEADSAQIQQVIMNMITNASDAIGGNAGKIELTTGVMYANRAFLDTAFAESQLSEGEYVYLEVKDTGCGMDKDTLDKIFDPFFTTKFAGRGLGLAAVLGIVRSHHGAIKVMSEPWVGTAFRVIFPASSRVEAAVAAENREMSEFLGSGTVLVVDDEETVLEVAKLMLEKFGFDVLTASHGQAALEILGEHSENIVAVLLDMTMPDMNGEETLREIRRLRSDVPVILSSGYSEQSTFGSLSMNSFSGFLQKPYGPGALIEKVREVLEP